MSEFNGYFVYCFQKFPKEGITDVPFKGQIVGESGYYWKLTYGTGSQVLIANKGACSTVPFRNESETKSKAYKDKVQGSSAKKDSQSEDAGRPRTSTPRAQLRSPRRNTASVEASKENARSRSEDKPIPRPKRSGNRKDPSPPRPVRSPSAGGLAGRFGARPKKPS